MGTNIREWFEQIKDRWQELSDFMKRVIVLGIISLVIILGTTYYFMTRVDYGVLFSDLSQADAGNIINDLKEKNIPYKLEDNGKTIMIEQNQIDSYRIDLAVEDKLPDSTTGFELFDESGMMTTDEDRKIMYQRALTGELERAIGSLSGVEGVKVILVTPDEGVFSRDKKEATASITLSLRSPLADAAVQGIVTLASGAVENLSPENVRVIDTDGNVLAGGQESQSVANTSDRYINIKTSYEETLENKVRTLLEPIYGTNRLKVSVNVDLDFDSVERTTTTYNNPEIRSESVEATGSADIVQEAQTGQMDDNVTIVTGDDTEGNRTYRRDVNNELDTEITRTISAPGMIRRMTSSVVVDGNLPNDVQQELRALVASAVGFNEERGDEIAIQGIDFGVDDAEDLPESPMEVLNPLDNDMLIYLAVIAGVVIVFITFTIILSIRRRRSRQEYLVDEEASKVELDSEILETLAQAQANLVNDETQEDIKDLERQRERAKYESRDKRAKQFAVDNPEIAAELIKAWMKQN